MSYVRHGPVVERDPAVLAKTKSLIGMTAKTLLMPRFVRTIMARSIPQASIVFVFTPVTGTVIKYTINTHFISIKWRYI